MSCHEHALCKSDYAGMVDVGEARPDPVVVGLIGIPPCCQCGEPAEYLLEAATDRFNSRPPELAVPRPDGFDMCHVHHIRTATEIMAAGRNAIAPRGRRRSYYVVQTDQPQVGQDSHPS